MKRMNLVMIVAIALTGATGAHADTETLLARTLDRNVAALAMVRATVADEAGARTLVGPAVCVDDSGVLMTLAFDRGTKPESIKECRILLPGLDGKILAAELLSVDPLTGLGLVRANEPHTWSAVRFDSATTPAIGGRIVSVGLMTGQPGYPAYLGAGYVSAVIRTPGRLAYVTGGKLTSPCSPVFNSSGEAIGIVAGQASVQYRMQSGKDSADVGLKTSYETGFFLPTAEFAHVLATSTSPGRPSRLPWLGVNTFEAAGSDDVGVRVKGLFPDQPAAAAGLLDGDVIVKLDGRPLERLATDLLTTQNFIREVMRQPVGQTITLTVRRDDKLQHVPVTLAAMPTLPSEAKRFYHPRLGVILREAVMLDQYMNNPPPKGVGMVVVATATDGAAADAGLTAGDVVIGIQGQTATSADKIQKIIADADEAGAEKVQLVIRRDSKTRKVDMTLPAKTE